MVLPQNEITSISFANLLLIFINISCICFSRNSISFLVLSEWPFQVQKRNQAGVLASASSINELCRIVIFPLACSPCETFFISIYPEILAHLKYDKLRFCLVFIYKDIRNTQHECHFHKNSQP